MRPPLIVLLCLSVLASTFSIGAFPALLPDIGAAGGLADWQLGLVAGAFGFARMLADIPVGLFITHHLRRALLAAPFVLALGVLCLGSGGPFGVLLLGRATTGLAHALGIIGGLTAILRYQTGRLASALSAYEFSAMIGLLGGTVVIGLLPGDLRWNAAFVITSSPLLVGILILPVVLGALPREVDDRPRPLFARGGQGAGASRSAPITPQVLLAFAAGGVVATAYSTLEQFEIPLRASREFGLDRSGIARLLITAQLCDIACLMPAGVLADRRGTPLVLGSILLIFGTGAALIAFGDFTFLVLGCALFGIGMAGWTLPLGLLRQETPHDQVGWRTALYRVGVDGGIFLGPFLSGILAGTVPGLLPAVLTVALLALGGLVLRRRR